jgi:hypothetical protein
MKYSQNDKKILPLHLPFPHFLEIFIRSGEWSRTEEAPISGKWTRMGRGDDMMFFFIDQ